MTIRTRNIEDGNVTAAKLGTGAVTAAKIDTGAVTAVKLSTTLKTGFIELPLAAGRHIVTNDIGVIAVGGAGSTGSGGILGSDGAATYAKLTRENGATDKKFVITFPADAANLPVAWDFVYPNDLDDTATVTVKFLARMAGATDSPVVAVSYFESGFVGAYAADTNAGGNSAAVTGTSVALYSVTITAANITAAPGGASIELVPATHTTNLMKVSAVWVEYTRA